MLIESRITHGFWRDRLDMNARQAIFHQWEQLEKSGCVDNFRIAAQQKDGFREGYFFADSDAYKWLEAASRILAERLDPRLKVLVDDFIRLLEEAQQPDGYLYTYNQIHFPGQRWVNLQIEHEFYCLGHLIEAGIAHHEATGERRLLDLIRRVADLLVRDFMEASPVFTDGHEQIEIALLRLHRLTGEESYFELARRLLERRGRIRFYPLHLLREYRSHLGREAHVNAERAAYIAAHPEHASFRLPASNPIPQAPLGGLRRNLSLLSGKSFQQNTTLHKQTVPSGHSVRFGYLATAATMLAGEAADSRLQVALQRVWRRMVTRRMAVTGGLGALPFIEGFGRDFELDPRYAYNETCAALASLFWNWEMAQLSGEVRYADLLEWQLYNAVSVGMGLDGSTYLYNNPLIDRGAVRRRPWYAVPCCPSNLSRTWASLGKYIAWAEEGQIHISQFISSQLRSAHGDWALHIDSSLPWAGDIQLLFVSPPANPFGLHLRIPSWAEAFSLELNGSPITPDEVRAITPLPQIACGYNPFAARRASITRAWQPDDRLTLKLDMPIRLLKQDRRLPRCGGMSAVSRGPIVYCLESVDNPDVDIFDVHLAPDSLRPVLDNALLEGMVKITGETTQGQLLTFIPYFLWGNRGDSQMNVFVNV